MGYYFLDEIFTFQELIGSVFIIGGVILIGKQKN
jgi:drug/metabolite transporter (DMT)-like permease